MKHTFADKQKNCSLRSPWGDDDKDNDIDKLLNSLNKGFKKFLGQNGGGDIGPSGSSSGIFATILAIIFIVWAATGLYIVEEDEQAAVLRFGKFVRIANPGPNYHAPFPFEKIIKHKVTIHQIEEFGYRSSSDGSNDDKFRSFARKVEARPVAEESLMLTGDENIVDINFLVRWKIDNIKNYTFNVQDPRSTVKMAAESAVREIIGNTKFAEAQTEGRSMVEDKSMKLLQEILDSYDSGIIILGLQMLKVDPPQQVIDSFRDVQTARADKERLINEAIAFRNNLLPEARGEADKIVQEAKSYSHEVIALAEGEAKRYMKLLEQYKTSKGVTRTRMYMDTMEHVLSGAKKIILDDKAKAMMPMMMPINNISKPSE